MAKIENLSDLKKNNRILIEVHNKEGCFDEKKGLILDIDEFYIYIVSLNGDLLEIPLDEIVSVTKISFDKAVSESLVSLREQYDKLLELKEKVVEMEEDIPTLKSNLFDSRFLSNFNLLGAKNRIINSINPEFLSFSVGEVKYDIDFNIDDNEKLELRFNISNHFEYHDSELLSNKEKVINAYSPNKIELLNKIFNFADKIEEGDTKVKHLEEYQYCVSTNYKCKILITKDNFLENKTLIINSLKKIKEC